MTKMKSKKMTKSTFAIIIMAVVMVAMLAFGGTYAYFTATASDKTNGEAKTALIQLTSGEVTNAATVKANALPGEEIANMSVALSDTSTRNTYVFALVTVKFGPEATAVVVGSDGKVGEDTVLNITGGASWTNAATNDFTVAGTTAVYYLTRTNEGDSAVGDAFNFDVKVVLDANLQENNAQKTEGTDTLKFMNQDVTVTVQFGAIQQANGDSTLSPIEAYNALKTSAATDSVTLGTATAKQ